MNILLYIFELFFLFNFVLCKHHHHHHHSRRLRSHVRRSTTEKFPVSDEKAEEYLKKYGYLKPLEISIDGTLQKNNTKENAIKEFQRFFGLEITGQLNDETKLKMAKPRCGVIDVKNVRISNQVPFKQNLIKYAFINFSPDITPDKTRKTIKKAFNIWSVVIPRDFIEVQANDPSVNILIGFATRSHGDNSPFDGTSGTLAHASEGGSVHFDDDEPWKIYEPSEKVHQTQIDFFWTAVHEIGHSLGLDHTKIQNSVLWPHYTVPVDENGNYVEIKLLPSDISDIQEIYGSRVAKPNPPQKKPVPKPIPNPPPPPPPPRQPKPSCSAMENNKDILGNDLQFIFGQPNECCKFCESNSECKAYVWKNMFNGMCFLKYATAPIIYFPNANLGYPSGGGPCSTRYSNMDIDGSDMGNKRGQLSDCCGICQTTFGCRAFIWTGYEGGTCWLKFSMGPRFDRVGFHIGIL